MVLYKAAHRHSAARKSRSHLGLVGDQRKNCEPRMATARGMRWASAIPIEHTAGDRKEVDVVLE